MNPRIFTKLAVFLSFFLVIGISFAEASSNATLSGRVNDINGKPVAGAEVYVFRSNNVKRPADFISPKTAAAGSYAVKLPTGKYWATAVSRVNNVRFGPLAAGDKHSGEAVSFEVSDNGSEHLDFTVLNLREAARRDQKKSDTLLKVSGRIINQDKKPVSMAYVMADKRPRVAQLPQYFSAWTDTNGLFTMYLPNGTFYLGAATGFPLENDYLLKNEILLEKDISGLEIYIEDKKNN